MPTITLASPLWLLLLTALLPVLLLRVRAHFLAKRGAPGLVSPLLKDRLITGSGIVWRWVRFALYSAACASVVIALARPRWGVEMVETQSHGRNVLIAIDTSRSMLANDVSPNRLSRAKLAAEDIVRALPGDRIGLIAFAGGAFVQAPLTVDHAAVVETLRQFDSEIIPRGGTNLASAVTIALETFRKADVGESALILFSDGEDLEGGDQLAEMRSQAAESGMTVIAIAVGTESGSIIPDPDAGEPGVFVKDAAGQIVRSRLNPIALQAISADSDNGLFLSLDSSRSISSVVAASLSKLQSTSSEEAERQRPIERFGWFLAVGLALFAAGWVLPDFRRRQKQNRPTSSSARASAPAPAKATSPMRAASKSGIAVALVIFSTHPLAWPNLASAQNAGADNPVPESDSPADSKSDAIGGSRFPDGRTAARAAIEALQDGKFEKATAAYRAAISAEEMADETPWLNLGLGSAAYKMGDYETAKEAFGKVLESSDDELAGKAQYNLANTLFRHGETFLDASLAQPDKQAAAEQWDSALEHYRGAIKLDPNNQRARHNAGVVEARLKLLRKAEEEEQQKQDEEDKQEPPKEEEPPPPDEEEEEEEEKKDEKEKEKEDEKKDEQNKDNEQEQKDGENQDQKNQGNGQDQNQDKGDQNKDQNQDQKQNQDPQGGGDSPQDNNNEGDNSDQEKGDNSNEGGQPPPSQPPGSNPEGGEGSDGSDGGSPPPGQENTQNPQDGAQPPGDGKDSKSNSDSNSENGQQPPSAKPQSGDGQEQNADSSNGAGSQPQSRDSSTSPADGSGAEAPPEGELTADPQAGSPQPTQPAGAGSANSQNAAAQGERDPNADVVNAETGYTPSEARRLLRTQSEEALRMLRVRVPQNSERYRNW